MESYQFDQLKERLDRMNELLLYLAYPELKPQIEERKSKAAI